MNVPLHISSALTLAAIVGVAMPQKMAQANSLSGTPLFLDPVLIDFDGPSFEAGDFIKGTEWEDYGVTLSVESTRDLRDGSGERPLRLFNSDCVARTTRNNPLPKCTGGDTDLATGAAFGTAPEGNVLIIQEDNSHKRRNRNKTGLDRLGVPDDDARGGSITFTFRRAVEVLSLGMLDFDDQDRGEGFVRAYTNAEDTTAALTLKLSEIAPTNEKFLGDNSLRKLDGFGSAMFQKLVVEYPGSGAITHLEFQEVAPGGSRNWLEEKDSHRW
jgi:hypothetical protein